MRRLSRLSAVLTAVSSLLLLDRAGASDNRSECFPLDRGAPYSFDAESNILHKEGIAEPLKYKTVERTRLRKMEGYCTTKAGIFKYETEVYGITVEAFDSDKPLTLRFRCETAVDATPAGLNCERDVKKQNFQAPLPTIERYR